jgi:hypothetical protein
MMAGRKELSELDKAKSKASRFYWKHQDTLTPEFIDEQLSREVQFAETDKRMGRPPVELSVIQSRALNNYSDALNKYREIEKNEGIEAISDKEIIEYKKSDRSGRKAKDEVLHIKKYIRRTQRQVNDLEDKSDKSDKIENKGPGRPGMGNSEKIDYYEKRIKEAEAEVAKLLLDKAEHEVIYYQLFELKNDRRTLVVAQKKHDEKSIEYSQFAKDIGLLNERIEPVQAKYDKALELAGIKHVRSAPSARVIHSNYPIEVSPDFEKTLFPDDKFDEQSEINVLRIELKEMKKMMMEQAELINALTSKK